MSDTGQREHLWLEAMRRFRFAGQTTAVVILLGWFAWFFPFDDLVDRSGTPLGGDYVMLYVAGQVVADGDASLLYDDHQNQQRTARLFTNMSPQESWPYRYPPTVAACMVPLAQLPFAMSFAVFLLIQLSLLTTGLALLCRDCTVLQGRSGWLWAMIGSPLVLESLIGGQSSLLTLTCLVGCLHFLKRGNDEIAGALLALTLYKPNVLALLIVALLIVRPRMWKGFAPLVVLGVLVALLTAGFSGLREYLSLGTQLASSAWSLETPFWKVHGLAPFYQWLSPLHGKLACALTGVLVAVATAFRWRAKLIDDNGAVAILLVCNALFNPYVPIYDLVLLLIALILVAESAYVGTLSIRSVWLFQMLAAVWFVGPHLSQAIAPRLGWQLFPVVLGGVLLTVLWLQIQRGITFPRVRATATATE